ncbi:MAG TPA: hypothetical protein VIP98_20850 [Microlunatus sp.]
MLQHQQHPGPVRTQQRRQADWIGIGIGLEREEQTDAACREEDD